MLSNILIQFFNLNHIQIHWQNNIVENKWCPMVEQSAKNIFIKINFDLDFCSYYEKITLEGNLANKATRTTVRSNLTIMTGCGADLQLICRSAASVKYRCTCYSITSHCCWHHCCRGKVRGHVISWPFSALLLSL